MKRIKTVSFRVLFIIVSIGAASSLSNGQDARFTYQGSLEVSGVPANGSFDLEFALFTALSGGTQIVPAIQRNGVQVADGIFTVELDFGALSDFLEVRVRSAGGGAFTTLTPRKRITRVPFSRFSDSSGNAFQLDGRSPSFYTNATNLISGTIPAGRFGNGVILNGQSVQQDSNFNISGTGRVGGNFFADQVIGRIVSADVIQAQDEFRISSTPVFRINFIDFNVALGNSAGLSTGGTSNLTVGTQAGRSLVNGSENTFIGQVAGRDIPNGSQNTYVGNAAGIGITGGNQNTGIGFRAGPNLSNQVNSTAIGANAMTTTSNTVVIGSIAGLNNATETVRVGIGTTTPAERLHVGGALIVAGPRTGTAPGNSMTFGSEAAFSEIQTFNNRPLALNPIGNRVGIGTTEPGATLDVNGSFRLTSLGSAGSTAVCRNAALVISTCSSSLRYKANLKTFRSGISIVQKLKPLSFTWAEGGMLDLGLGAEDVAAVEPLLVTYNDKGEVEGVKYDRIGVVLVNAMKEQQELIESQKAEIERLKNRLTQVDSDVAAIKAMVCQANPNAAGCAAPKSPEN